MTALKNLLLTCWMHVILQWCNNRTDLISTVHELIILHGELKVVMPYTNFSPLHFSSGNKPFRPFFFSKCFMFYYFPFLLSILLTILVDNLFIIWTGKKIYNHVTWIYSVLPETEVAELHIHFIRVELVATADKYMEFGVGPRRVTSMVLASGQHNTLQT
jgi:hypothetical protein